MYDTNGIRTSKTINGVKTSFYYDGNGQLIRSDDGTVKVDYLYDQSGMPFGLKYNGSMYYYVTNVQGDIIGILDQSGSKVVDYVYDSWGKLISISGSAKDTVGLYNALRYRGYYYDTETGLYYLNSRYYDPVTGRFLNADSIIGGNIGSAKFNLFTYCGNNPVNLSDPTGSLPGTDMYASYLYGLNMNNVPASVKSDIINYVDKKKTGASSSINNIIPSGNAILGSAVTIGGNVTSNVTSYSNLVKDANNMMRYVPGNGIEVQKFPKISKTLGTVGTILTVESTATDLYYTWTAENNNTSEQRLLKSGIQLAGTVGGIGLGMAGGACISTGVAAFAAGNIWNPIGWIALGGIIIIGAPYVCNYGVDFACKEFGIE